MKNRRYRMFWVLWAAVLAAMLACVWLTACRDQDAPADEPTETETRMESETAEDTSPTVTEQDTDPAEETPPTTDEQESETMPQTPELFAPDPTRAVPQYDALMENLDNFPLAFTYGETAYAGFAGFALESEQYEDIDRGVESTLIFRHPAIPAAFTLVARVFPEEHAYEYVVYIENDGTDRTDVVSDLRFEMPIAGDTPTLNGIKGDAGGVNYKPYSYPVSRRSCTDRSTSGRPTHSTFPYYNLSHATGGTFVAIGWPGTWYATFEYNKKTKVTTLTAGQESVATYIAPGEILRTPLMGFVEYEGLNEDEQANAWRRYYINDVMRKIDGELTPTYAGVASMSAGMTTESFQKLLQSYRDHGIDPEVLWMDAGWYTGAAGESVAWTSTGSLDMDTTRFPDSMAAIGADAAENDMMMLLWFEPENMRLDPEAFLAGQSDFKEEWLLGTVGEGSWLEGQLINLGDADCREWIFHKICTVIDAAGVTGYRQDFNNDPAVAWQANDAKYENRTGMTENQYVQGYLALWDALIEKYGLFMDSCASGGGRNDLESMKRAVPLHYSDWFDGNGEDYDMKGKMTQALFSWFPYFKNELYDCSDIYKARMNYAPFSLLKLSNLSASETQWKLLKQAYGEYDQVRAYFYADYYQLTEWTANADRRNAWMFYDDASAAGYASIFFPEATSTLSEVVKFKGLDAEKTYHITDFDGLVDVTATGAELMETGVTVTVPKAPYCAILLINSTP